MFSQVILASLFVTAAIAAPAPSMNDGATPIIELESYVPCTDGNPASVTSVPSPSVILLGNPAPSPSVILLNNPAPPPPTAYSASNPYAGYAAAPQPSGTPPVVNLNAPAASPSIIKLNRRQFGSTSAASVFSFGGIVPSSTVPSNPHNTTTSPPSSFSFGAIPTSPPSPASTGAPNNISVFTSTGSDGRETVFMLATVTVTGAACSSAPVFNPGFTPISSLAPSSNPPFVLPASTTPSSPTSPASSFFGANVQSPVSPSTTPLPNASIINLNTPTSDAGFSFSSAPTPTSA